MRTALVVAATFVVLAPAALGQELTKDDREGFAWFDKLGYYPELSKAELVRVATGSWYLDSSAGKKKPTFEIGFLIEEKGDDFTIFLPRLERQSFKKRPAKGEDFECSFEKLDLAKEAAKILEDLPKRDADRGPSDEIGYRYLSRTEVFVFARAAAAHGLDKTAHELCKAASKMPARNGEKGHEDLVDALSEEIGYQEIWRVFIDFNRREVTRPQLLAALTKFLPNFPDDAHTKLARETAEILEKMIAEDAAHTKPAKPLADLPVKERVAELIFDLRDQFGYQWSDPGHCDFFMRREEGEWAPADELVKIGYDAVPQLIEALEDTRFTRGVGHHRSFYFSHFVLRIGDCALAILERIAGQSFYSTRSTSGAMVKDGDAKDVKKRVAAWWAEFGKKGEKQALIDGALAGNAEQAQRLAEKFPKDAPEVLAKAVRAASQGWVRANLIHVAANAIKGDEVLPLLREELKGPQFTSRIAAASALERRGFAGEAVAAMVDEWDRFDGRTEVGGFDSSGGLIEFLSGSGDVHAIEALGKRWKERTVDVRLDVVRYLAGVGRPDEEASKKLTEETRVALRAKAEEILIAALDDTDERTGMSSGWTSNGKGYSDPRVCDAAGDMLTAYWKEKYTYDPSAPLATRDRDRVRLKNVWRAEHGLPPLDVPGATVLAPASDEETTPLLAKLIDGNAAEQDEAARKLEALGTHALAAVEKRAGELAAGESKARLIALAQKLASTVTEVAIAPGSKLAPELGHALDELKGKPLEARRFIGIVTKFMATAKPGQGGLKLGAHRVGDGTGVRLTLELAAPSGGAELWEESRNVSIDGHPIHGAFSSASPSDGEAHFSFLAAAIDKALGAEPAKPFDVRITLYERK
jgi:hypothetical protein